MPNKFVKNENGSVSVRLDGVFTNYSKYFVSPYTQANNKESFFGSFKFKNAKDAKETLKKAVKMLDGVDEDNVFEGQYPRWVEDNYGASLKVNNRVKFIKNIETNEIVNDYEIEDFIYSLELHLSATKEKKIFLRAPRCVVMSKKESQTNDALFAEDDLPF